MTNLVGKTLGPYTLETELGKGGMATVYRAYQSSVKRYVAVKVMAPEIASEPGFVERFAQEAEVIAKLEHPHILPVIDYGEADGFHYIVMRFMNGGSLDERLRKSALSMPEIIHYMSQISAALDYAHRHGVIHRDLKPNNVLLDTSDNTYLTDFGIARLAGSDRKLTSTGMVVGTPSYMSPEQAMGRPVDSRSDIYTLGVMLYEMVLNKLPFTADTPAALIFQHVYEQPRSPKSLNPNLSDAIVAILDRALIKSPDARYQTATALTNAFADAVNGRITPPPVDNTPVQGYEPTISVASPVTHKPVGTKSSADAEQRTYIDSPNSIGAVQATSMSTPANMPRKGSPLMLIIGGLLGLLILGGGAFLLLGNKEGTPTPTVASTIAQTNAETSTVIAIAANSTATAAQIVQASQTATELPTSTSTATSTITMTSAPTFTTAPTNTHTPVPSETPTPTMTPNLEITIMRMTSVAEQTMTQVYFDKQSTTSQQTLAAIDLQFTQIAQTSTAYANLVNTSSAATATLDLKGSATKRAANNATDDANRRATLNASNTEIAATALAQSNSTATPISTVEPTSQAALNGLLSNEPINILNELRSADIIPASLRPVPAAVAADVATYGFKGLTDDENVYYINTIRNTRLSNFIVSMDVSLQASDAGIDKTACGVFFNAALDDKGFMTDSLIFSFRRDTYFSLYKMTDQKFGQNSMIDGNTSAIKTTNRTANRLTMVYADGKLTVLINGNFVINNEVVDTGTGLVGYYYVKGVKGLSEGCQLRNTRLWRLN